MAKSTLHNTFWQDRYDIVYNGVSITEIARRHGRDKRNYFRFYKDHCESLNIPRLGRFEKWLILGCVHVPFHNETLWNNILKFAHSLSGGLTGVILNGDFLDLMALSSHDKGNVLPPGFDLSTEYQAGRAAMAQLVSAIHPTTKRVWLYGNHEDRYFRYKRQLDGSKLGDAIAAPHDALFADEHGFQVFTNWKDDYYRLGDHLDVMHGIYVNEHAAKKHMQQCGGSVVFNHTHRIQTHIEGDKAAFNAGCLIQIDHDAFSYQSRVQRRRWANGFALVYIDHNGNFHVQNVTCWADAFVVEGQRYG